MVRVHGPCCADYISCYHFHVDRRVLVESQPFHLRAASIIPFMNNSINMVENLIKTYRITPERLQDYLQRLFPGHNIVITVSKLYHIRLRPGTSQG